MTTRNDRRLTLVTLITLEMTSIGSAQTSTVAPPEAAVQAFLDRATEYVTLQRRIESTMPPVKETDEVARLAAHERALGESIRLTRGKVAEGSIFGSELRPYFVQIIEEDWRRRTPRDRAGVLREVPKGLSVAVNMSYPTTVPLATFPPVLLARVPALPKELEYRFFGRHLILRDVKANLIVDILRDVIPVGKG